MNKDELFDKIYKTIDQSFINMNSDKELRLIYGKDGYNYNEDIKDLKETICEELNDCYKNIREKEVNTKEIEECIYLDQDKHKYDIFVILPIFNATNAQAERCIYSIIDNYEELNYKLLIINNI